MLKSVDLYMAHAPSFLIPVPVAKFFLFKLKQCFWNIIDRDLCVCAYWSQRKLLFWLFPPLLKHFSLYQVNEIIQKCLASLLPIFDLPLHFSFLWITFNQFVGLSNSNSRSYCLHGCSYKQLWSTVSFSEFYLLLGLQCSQTGSDVKDIV